MSFVTFGICSVRLAAVASFGGPQAAFDRHIWHERIQWVFKMVNTAFLYDTLIILRRSGAWHPYTTE
jgi:hypothetical protein